MLWRSDWLLLVALGVLVFHFVFIANRGEWAVIGTAAAFGFSVDSLLQVAGVFEFGSRLAPLWLLCLWLVFATTFQHALAWFQRRLWISAVVGAFSGSSTYAVAVFKFEAAHTQLSLTALLLVLALVWALLFPLLMWLSRQFTQAA